MQTSEFSWPQTPADTVALTNRVTKWLQRAGVSDEDRRVTLAVGIADSLSAAVHVAKHVERMLASDPITIDGAETALTAASGIEAWLFGELKDHLLELEECWESEIIDRLGGHLPPSPDEELPEPAV